MSCKCFFFWLIFCFYLPSSIHGSDNSAAYSLDEFLQDAAFKALVRQRLHTGSLYKASLPGNLSGMEVSVVRLRSKTLWNFGAKLSDFYIPPRTLSVPHVKRLAIVYQNLGNWSSNYYKAPGYSFLASVIGFLVFDASNVSAGSMKNISLNLMGKPVSMSFPNLILPHDMISAARCVAFSSNGTVHFSDVIFPNMCYTSDQGHFSIVLGVERKKRPWYICVIGTVLGCAALVLVGYFAVAFLRRLRGKESESMEKQGVDGEILDRRWIGSSSKLPSATMTRTQPEIEND